MLLHDVGIQGLHVVFGVDRAGLVGEDGETHHGLFDVAYLATVPGMTVLAPASFAELRSMLFHAVREEKGPVALRYPRGGESTYHSDHWGQKTVILEAGQGITLVTYGTLTGEVLTAAERLRQDGYSPEVIKLNQIHPLDWKPVLASVTRTGRLLVAEECAAMGCVGERIAAGLAMAGLAPRAMALCNTGAHFIPQGTVAEQKKLCGLDVSSLYERALEVLRRG